MTIAQEIERIESRDRELEQKLETERRRNDMQAGALRESRAENIALLKRVEEQAAQLARYDKHFRDALGSGESIVKHRAELAPVSPLPSFTVPEKSLPSKLRDKLSRLREVAA